MDDNDRSVLPEPVDCPTCGEPLALNTITKIERFWWDNNVGYFYESGDYDLCVWCDLCQTFKMLRDLGFIYDSSDDYGELIPTKRRAMAKQAHAAR